LASWWGRDWLHGTLNGIGRCGWGLDGLKLACEPLELPPEPAMLKDGVFGAVLIPAVCGKALRMASSDKTKCIDLSFTVSSLPSVDAALWVTHCEGEGRFFCLEPWVGWPNGISSGRGRIELEPGDVWSMSLQLKLMSIGQADAEGVPMRGAMEHLNRAVVDSIPRPGHRSAAKRERIKEGL
jgi:hypothetical protein